MGIEVGGAQLNIANGIREFAVASPDRVAVIDGTRASTFAEVHDRSNRVAQMLLATGLHPGAHVAFLSANRLEYVEVAAGIAKAGMVMIPLNPRSPGPELAFVTDHSDAQAFIGDDGLSAQASEAASGLDRVWSFDGTELGEDYEAALATAAADDPFVQVPETEPFTIAYTSGTTGDPKGVMISHRSRTLTFYCAALGWGFGPARRTIAVAPMFHGAGFAFAYGAVHTGGTLSMLRSFDPIELLAMVERDRPHTIFMVPAHAIFLRQLGEEVLAGYDTSSLETIYFNAAPLPQPVKEWVHAAFPHVGIHELYGSTEAGVVTDLRPDRIMDKERCVGPPWFMNEVELRDDDGSPTPRGEVGELYTRSPFLMNGYYKNVEATAASTTDDGFFSAGDLAWQDGDNCFYIVDRKKDMIISGGSNVYPSEVEAAIVQIEGVAEAAVIGLDDDTWGERVVAVIVSTSGEALDAARLDAQCRARMADYKVPRQWEFVADLPRNAGGKVLKRDLRESLSSRTS